MEIDSIYHMQKRVYWETDSVNRCIDWRLGGVGLCDLPYETLADEETILDKAYGLYCDISYNATLDVVVDEVERCIATGYIGLGRRGYHAETYMF